mmetsp:Transcript_15962/g.32757  ORF Transcript_15962/g.32757 Transcript_15962/m.32757 type:complete len:223 (-) Transcript_15962:232-900(-)
MARERQYARQVIPHVAVLLLAVVSHRVVAAVVRLAEDVEEERVDVEVEGFVVEEQLGDVTEVLTVLALSLSVDFEHAQIALPINFVTRWVSPPYSPRVPLHAAFAIVEPHSALVYPKALHELSNLLLRERAEVPRVHLVPSQHNRRNVLNLRYLLMLPQARLVHTLVFVDLRHGHCVYYPPVPLDLLLPFFVLFHVVFTLATTGPPSTSNGNVVFLTTPTGT